VRLSAGPALLGQTDCRSPCVHINGGGSVRLSAGQPC